MKGLRFTAHVLGTEAAQRLRDHEVTQTIRSEPQAVGDDVSVTLDGEIIGTARITGVIPSNIRWLNIGVADARRGGFETKVDLGKALLRAGYRFKPLAAYELYRTQFEWLAQEE